MELALELELAEQQQQLQNAAIEFARAELNDDVIRRDREEIFSIDGWKKCARFGALGLPVPSEYGGMGLGINEVIAVMEGLGYGARDQGLLFSINAHLWTNTLPILTYGTEEQKRKYLPGLCNGELIGANGASEPDAGSDIFAMRTRAERRGDCYVLNGTKTFVSNATVANLFVVYATVDAKLGPMGITAFVIERDTPGLKVTRAIEKMGLRTSPMAEITLEDCTIPAASRLGREGRGVGVFEASMEWERGCILANYLGVMRRQLESCIDYVRKRKQFGQPIGKFQSVANHVVDMKVRLDTCRPLVYRIGWLKAQNKPATVEAAVAKLYVAQSLIASCQDAIQIFGGYGYMTEQGLERDLRDAIASTLYSGTSEIQKNLIAKGLGL
jgi:alkylation response protein AidB-like acyl-CoA dehydrogenase